MWAAKPGLERTGVAQAVLARQSRGCEVGVLPQEGGTGGSVPFPGQLLSLANGPGPLSPAPEAGGVYLDFTGALPAAAVSAPVCPVLYKGKGALMLAGGCWHSRVFPHTLSSVLSNISPR